MQQTDILSELLQGTDVSFGGLEQLDFVKEIKKKYATLLEKKLGEQSDELLQYALDSPEVKDEVCNTLLFEPREAIIRELGLTDQANEINRYLKEMYIQGEQGLIDTCAEAVQDHLDDIVDLDEKIGLDQDEIDQYLNYLYLLDQSQSDEQIDF